MHNIMTRSELCSSWEHSQVGGALETSYYNSTLTKTDPVYFFFVCFLTLWWLYIS